MGSMRDIYNTNNVRRGMSRMLKSVYLFFRNNSIRIILFALGDVRRDMRMCAQMCARIGSMVSVQMWQKHLLSTKCCVHGQQNTHMLHIKYNPR